MRVSYVFSHIDFVTLSELPNYIALFGSSADGPNPDYFPQKAAMKLME